MGLTSTRGNILVASKQKDSIKRNVGITYINPVLILTREALAMPTLQITGIENI